MADPKIVVIGIQARTDSKRLPGKIHELVGNETVLDTVIKSCESAADFITRSFHKCDTLVKVAVLAPDTDIMVRNAVFKHKSIHLITAPDENDVLSRYATAVHSFKCDLIVRVTADCVFIPSFVISRHIKAAIICKADYTTNTIFRTFPEGFDCEVLSPMCIQWLVENATSLEDKEHVTSYIRKALLEKMFPYKAAFVIDHMNLSSVKTSIDTKEDLERARKFANSMKTITKEASKYGTVQG